MDRNVIKENINNLFLENKDIVIYEKKDVLRKKILSHYTNPKNKSNPTNEEFVITLKKIESDLLKDEIHKKIDLTINKISNKILKKANDNELHYEILKIFFKGVKKSLLETHTLNELNKSHYGLKLFTFKTIKPVIKNILKINKPIQIKHFDFFKQFFSMEDKNAYLLSLIANNLRKETFSYNKKERIINIEDTLKIKNNDFDFNIKVYIPFEVNEIEKYINKDINGVFIKNRIVDFKNKLENEIDNKIEEEYNKYKEITQTIKNEKYNMSFNPIKYSGKNNFSLFNEINRKIKESYADISDIYNKLSFQNNIGKRAFAEMFPMARSRTRHFTFFVGETGSGKTYSAFQRLKGKDSGLFLAPLRLLALEGQETIEKLGYPCNLMTGEEQDIKENAVFCASTIEMLDLKEEYDILVIDECQLLFDPDRGWAWTQAIVGANADEIIVTGSEEALKAIKFLTEYTGDTLEVVHLKKKTKLEKYPHKVKMMKDIPEHTAVVCFSKKRILELKNTFEKETGKHASVIFGALSPETRKEEARRFREGETKVVFATDAIGLGLNLPIKNVFFDKIEKFDGKEEGIITSSLAKQIAGRAGRYGFFDTGYYGVFNNNHEDKVTELLKEDYPEHTNHFYYKIPFIVFEEISELIESKNCFEIINKFIELYDLVEGNFIKMDYTDLVYKASVIEKQLSRSKNEDVIDLYEKYKLIFSPLDVKNEDMKSFFNYLIKEKLVTLKDFDFNKDFKTDIRSIRTMEDLNLIEYKLSLLDAYNWLAFNFSDIFKIEEKYIKNEKSFLNELVMFFLKEDGQLYKKCQKCHTHIALGKYNFCNPCYKSNNNKAHNGVRKENYLNKKTRKYNKK
jgi:ATP-dependent RNA helicase SUPV3L1/SUV3